MKAYKKNNIQNYVKYLSVFPGSKIFKLDYFELECFNII